MVACLRVSRLAVPHGRRTRRVSVFWQRLAFAATFALCLPSSCGGGDPPGDGFLFLSLDRTATRAGYTALDFRVTQVALFYDDVTLPPDDPVACRQCLHDCKHKHGSKQVQCTRACPCLNPCDTSGAAVVPLEVGLHVDLTATGRLNLASVATRPGKIQEVRVFVEDVSVTVDGTTITANPFEHPLKSIQVESSCKPRVDAQHKVHFGGVLRLVPVQGQDIVIQSDRQVAVVSPFDPNTDIKTLIDKQVKSCHFKGKKTCCKHGNDHAGYDPDSEWQAAAGDDQFDDEQTRRLEELGLLEHRCTGGKTSLPPHHCQQLHLLLFQLKSKYPLSLVPDEDAVLDDRIVVAFKSGVTRAQIQAIIAANGYSVIAYDETTNYYVLRLPTGTALQSAIQFFDGLSETAFDLPDTKVLMRQVFPCDPEFQNPGPLTEVNAPGAWATTTGSTHPVLADIDQGFDMNSADMIPNYFINAGELPAALTQDTAPADGFMDADFDQDGFITFRDLNAPGLTAAQLALLASVGLTQPVSPATLLAALSDGVDNDDFDSDPATFVDDLIGWDFVQNDNDPTGPGISTCTSAHGVGTSGIIAAVGATGGPPCASGLVAGVDWTARLLPIRNGGAFGVNQSTRSTSYLAIRYAVQMGSAAINASWGVTYNKGGGCGRAINNIGNKFDQLNSRLQQEGARLGLGNSILVVAAENCNQNDDSADTFDWPVELNNPNIVTTTSVSPANAGAVLAANRAYGPASIDISANGENHTMLGYGVTIAGCSGNSFTAPQVVGTIGLMIANNPALEGNPAALINRVLCNAIIVPALAGQVGGGGRVLEINQSVVNTNGCVP